MVGVGAVLRRIEEVHADCPHLIRQKAKGLFFVLALCQLGVFFMAWVDISAAPEEWKRFVLVYLPMTLSLLASLAGILVGHYQRWANFSFVWNACMVCLASVASLKGGHPEDFFVTSGYYHHAIILGASLFVSRRIHYLIIAIVIGWIPFYWLVFCDELTGEAARLAGQGAVELTVGTVLIAGLSVVSLRLMEGALERAQSELERNVRFQEELEATVAERTREAVLARGEAERSNRAKSEFLANMSHEIRTPLNGVLGAVEMLKGTPLEASQQEWTRTIADSGSHLLDLIQGVLDYSKIEAGEMLLESRSFGLRRLLAGTGEMLAQKIREKGLRLEIDLPEENPQVNGDELRLRQVLINLLGNAVKFTEQGTVGLWATWSIEDGLCRTCIRVRDSGIGMSDSALKAVFERFSQADTTTTRRFGGTGLGLAISREIVTLMGGTLEASSQEGSGSEFRVVLEMPLSDEDDTAEREVLLGEREPLSGKILLVEDNLTNQRVASGLLSRLGLEVEIAPDGVVALEMLGNSPYRLVLMDCQMPRMSGFDAVRELRTWKGKDGVSGRNALIPVVALTANVFAQTRDECRAAGMDGFLPKPFRMSALRDELSRWL